MLPPTWFAAWMNQSLANTGSRRMLRAPAASIVTLARESRGTAGRRRGVEGPRAATPSRTPEPSRDVHPARGRGGGADRGLYLYDVRRGRFVRFSSGFRRSGWLEAP